MVDFWKRLKKGRKKKTLLTIGEVKLNDGVQYIEASDGKRHPAWYVWRLPRESSKEINLGVKVQEMGVDAGYSRTIDSDFKYYIRKDFAKKYVTEEQAHSAMIVQTVGVTGATIESNTNAEFFDDEAKIKELVSKYYRDVAEIMRKKPTTRKA